MAKQKSTPATGGEAPTPRFNLGDRVRILHSDNQRGRIVELWGPLGPGGVQAYRVRIRGRSKPTYVDLCEDQLEVIPRKRDLLPGMPKADRAMAKQESTPLREVAVSTQLLNLGDRVRILHSDDQGRIVELCGPLGPGGVQVYRVRIRGRSKPTYIEVREDQLTVIPPKK